LWNDTLRTGSSRATKEKTGRGRKSAAAASEVTSKRRQQRRAGQHSWIVGSRARRRAPHRVAARGRAHAYQTTGGDGWSARRSVVSSDSWSQPSQFATVCLRCRDR
jgi:hypothetical protein